MMVRRVLLRILSMIAVVVMVISQRYLCLADRRYFVERPSNVTVLQGGDLLLRCVVGTEGRINADSTKWSKDAVFMDNFEAYPRYRMIGDAARGEYHLSISNAQLEDDDNFACQVDPAPGEEIGIRTIAWVNVLVPPSEVSIIRPGGHGARIEVKSNTNLDVSCRAVGAKPAARLLWYRKGVLIPAQYFDNTTIPEDSKRFTTISRLRMPVSRQDNSAVYTCEAEHPVTAPSVAPRAQFTLSVIYPPGQPVITGYNAGRALTAGDLIHLRCMADNGNPASEVIWYRNSVSVARNFTSKPDYTTNEYSFVVQPSDNEAEYRCEASNVATVSPLSSSVRLKVYFAPERVDITGPEQAKLADTVQFTCTSSSSHPVAKLVWLVDGDPFYDHAQRNWTASTTDGSGTQSSSQISVKISHRRPEITITCSARNEQIPGPDTVARKIIHVYYPPESAKIISHDHKQLVAGDSTTLTCLVVGGHPAPTIEWFKGSQKVTSATTSRYDPTHNTTISEYIFVLTPQDNLEKVECRGFNWASDGERVSNSITMSVLFPPESVTITPNPAEFAVGAPAALICESGSANPSPMVEWFRDEKKLPSVLSHNKTGSHGGWTMTKKLALSLSAQENGAIFECRVWSTVSRSVISETVMVIVKYKPVLLVPISQHLEVLEGESVLLNASAYSNPPVDQYVWQREQHPSPRSVGSPPRITVTGPIVQISSADRNDSGVYTCTAKNLIGESIMTAAVFVKYPASIKRVTPTIYANPSDNVSLVCDVDAYPSPPNIARWEHPRSGADAMNGDDSRFVRTAAAGSVIFTINGLRREDTGNYTCVANNGIGREDFKTTLILVRQAPVLDHSSLYTKAAGPIGNMAELSCLADGIPEIKFSWNREDKGNILSPVVYKSERISIISKRVSFMRYKSSVIIRNVMETDYGMYRCLAENEIGSSSVAVRFGQPEAPEKPSNIKVLNKTHDSITLGWSAGFSGGLPQQFRIRYHVQQGTGIRNVFERHTTGTTFTVDELKPKTTYTFSLRAVNEVGSSASTNLTVDTPGPARIIQEMTKEDLPVLVIVLVALAGVILLIVNAALVVCFLRRHHRKKLEERAATARLGAAPVGGRKVQMYSSDGAAVIGDYQDNEKYGSAARSRSEMSDGNSSVRTVIEVDGTVGKSGYIIAGGSPPSQKGYLLEGMNQEYDNVSNDASYADVIRTKTSTLQRYLTDGVYNIPRASVRQPSNEDPIESTYIAAQPVDDVLPSPRALRHPTVITPQSRDTYDHQEYDTCPYEYAQPPASSGQQNVRRFASSDTAQGQGRTPCAEVRPLLLSSSSPNDALPVHGSLLKNSTNNNNRAKKNLTTFATSPLNSLNLPDELDDVVDSASGDLV